MPIEEIELKDEERTPCEIWKASPERIAAQFVADGILSVDADGNVWRHYRKVGGNQGPRLVAIDPVRAENRLSNGRSQVQVYLAGARVVCSVYRLVWFLAYGDIPDRHHIHHIDGDVTNNRLDNLECVIGSQHIARHGIGRTPHNKGTAYGETDAYRKAHANRINNYAQQCRYTHELWKSGLTQARCAKQLGISRRQVCDRLRYYRSNSDV